MTNHGNLKFWISFVFVICHLSFVIFILPSPVHAQTLSLSLWPPLLELTIIPGKTFLQEYQITNNSDRPLPIIPQIYPFLPQGEQGQIHILTQNQAPEFFSFTTRERWGEPFLLEIGQTRKLILKISIPKDQAEKLFYRTLLFTTAVLPPGAVSTTGLNQAGSVTRLGSNLLLTVSRVEKPFVSGRIEEFTAPRIVDSFSPARFTLRLTNTGSHYWKPFGQIEITGWLKQKQSLKLLEQNVLGGTTRRLTIPDYQPQLPIGPFKARLEFNLNQGPESLSQEIVIWYLPYKAALVFLLLWQATRLFRKLKPENAQTLLIAPLTRGRRISLNR